MSATKKQTYEYTDEFQMQIASFILRDETFMREYIDVVNPTYFDLPELVSLTRIGKTYFDKHNEIPTKASLLQEVEDYTKSSRLTEDDINSIHDKIDRIYSFSMVNEESVKERICRFGRRQALRQAVIKMIDLIDRDSNLDRCEDIVQSACRVGYNAVDNGVELYSNFSDVPKLVRRDDRGYTHKIKTHFPLIDTHTMGGPGRGEVWCILGLSGQGKSQFLVNVGVAASDQGFPVVHITIGDLDAEDVMVRYASCITGLSQKEVIEESHQFMREANKQEKSGRYLKVKYYDPGVCTVSHIKAFLSKIRSVDGVKPGLMIVDYPDEMKLDGENTYQSMGTIYSGLKALANQYNMVVWVASQVHRWTPRHKNDVLMRGNISDSAKKVHKADGIVSINQSYDEAQANYGRLWCDKVRRGKAFFAVPVQVDFSMSRIWQIDDFYENIKDENKSEEDWATNTGQAN